MQHSSLQYNKRTRLTYRGCATTIPTPVLPFPTHRDTCAVSFCVLPYPHKHTSVITPAHQVSTTHHPHSPGMQSPLGIHDSPFHTVPLPHDDIHPTPPSPTTLPVKQRYAKHSIVSAIAYQTSYATHNAQHTPGGHFNNTQRLPVHTSYPRHKGLHFPSPNNRDPNGHALATHSTPFHIVPGPHGFSHTFPSADITNPVGHECDDMLTHVRPSNIYPLPHPA
jgi:hypothetical protein